MSSIKSTSPNQMVTGPVHHVYPNTSPPKRPYFGPPTPDMTPESSETGESIKPSEESNHGSPIVSPSTSTEPSTSSSEVVNSVNHFPRSVKSVVRAPAPDSRRKMRASGRGHTLPYSIREEDEFETSTSSRSTRSIPKSMHQKKSISASSATNASGRNTTTRPAIISRPSKDRSSKKRRSFRKRVRRIFGGGKSNFSGGENRSRH